RGVNSSSKHPTPRQRIEIPNAGPVICFGEPALLRKARRTEIMDTIFVIATHTAKSKARTGIQTVVRGLLWGLSQRQADVQVVRRRKWHRTLSTLGARRRQRLGLPSRTERIPGSDRRHGVWLLL